MTRPLKYSLSSSRALLYGGIVYVAWRMACANRMPIMDCDEVFNYWEPLHYLVFGTGMQTWEYAPQYALRTHAYLLPMAALAHLYNYVYHLLSPNARAQFLDLLMGTTSNDTTVTIGVWTFCWLRTTLAGVTALAEVSFLASLERYSKPVALITGMLLLTSTGMAHAAGAYLPSSTIMCCWLVCVSAYLQQHTVRFVAVAVLATLAVGWPFGVVVFVPMGLHIVIVTMRSSSSSLILALVKLLAGTLAWTICVQATVMIVDNHYYSQQQQQQQQDDDDSWRLESSIVNILRYNAKEGGDELYGVEPPSYYIKNLLLNFNYVAILALLSLPLATWMKLDSRMTSWPVPLVVSCVAPLYLWLSILLPRPHKEERFLFPIYPALCACAAMTLEQVWIVILTIGSRLLQKGTQKRASANSWASSLSVWMVLLIVPSCLLGISRTMALQKYYTAPLSVYRALAQQAVVPEAATRTIGAPSASNDDLTPASSLHSLVCTCGEWHRFPSSFFLPPGYQLGFLPCSFKGQLPKPFGMETGVFNDENRQEMDRYVSSVDKCAYVVELEERHTDGDDDVDGNPECLTYMQQSQATWTKIASYPYLDAAKTSAIHRILYLPRLHQKAVANGAVHYNEYSLYRQE